MLLKGAIIYLWEKISNQFDLYFSLSQQDKAIIQYHSVKQRKIKIKPVEKFLSKTNLNYSRSNT